MAVQTGAPLAAELIVANAPDPVFVCDLNGKILVANDAVFHLLGFRPAELIEQSLSHIIPPDETREFVAAVREVVDKGATRNARLHPRSASDEIIPTTLNASALRDASGNVIGVIGILRDMRELDEARRYAESLIKNAPDPVFVTNLEGKILQTNDAVSELLGFREDEVVEQSVSRFISSREAGEFVAALREIVERGVTRNVRLNPRSASGDVIPTMLNASALRAVAAAKQVALHAVVGPSAGPVVGDPKRLQQVVWDLRSHAIQFAPQQGVIELTLEQADGGARITVRDTGPGISPHLLPHI